jgi:hypothetical protein
MRPAPAPARPAKYRQARALAYFCARILGQPEHASTIRAAGPPFGGQAALLG